MMAGCAAKQIRPPKSKHLYDAPRFVKGAAGIPQRRIQARGRQDGDHVNVPENSAFCYGVLFCGPARDSPHVFRARSPQFGLTATVCNVIAREKSNRQ